MNDLKIKLSLCFFMFFTVALSGVSFFPAIGYCEQKLVASNPDTYDKFGHSIDISGDYLVVGVPKFSSLPPNPGRVFVYQLINEQWTETAEILNPSGVDGDGFGFSVAIDGDTIVVGSPYYDAGGLNSSGAAYVFERNGNSWTFVQQLTDSNGAAFDQLGTAVDVDGDSMLIGAPGDADGSVYAYQKNLNNWIFVNKVYPSNSPFGLKYGSAISLDGQKAVVGAPEGNSFTGLAYVIRNTGNFWAEQAVLSASDSQVMDQFGRSVALSGDTVLVGAPENDEYADRAGAVYVFEYNGTVWSEVDKFANMQIGPVDRFGKSVSLIDDIALIGASGDVAAGQSDGKVFTFGRLDGSWNERSEFTPSDATSYDDFGFSAVTDGEHFIVGAPGKQNIPLDPQGAVYAYTENFNEYCFCPAGPCGNNDSIRGCQNSTGQGGYLTVIGSPDPDLMTLFATGVVPGQPVRFIRADNMTNNGDGIYFGDGLRCASGAVERLGIKIANAQGQAMWGPLDGDPSIATQPGDIKRYQAWYRDPMSGSPCGSGFNLTNGVEVNW